MNYHKNFIFIICSFVLLFVLSPSSLAQESEDYYINISRQTASRGYTIKAFDGLFSLILPKAALKDATGVTIKKINQELVLPWQLDKLSGIFQFEVMNQVAYDGSKPLVIEIKYDKSSVYYKQIYFYDKNYSSWRPLPTIDYPDKSFARSLIHLPFARLAVFANPNALVVGQASWYQYKKGLFAASPDFPKGSKLRVYNLENGKQVEVVVNDFGPDRRLHPDRPIDLEKEAFRKIAKLSQGTVKVRVEPISLGPKTGRLLGISALGAMREPVISAKSAVVINEQTGEIIWQKNATSARPLASLTKLVAIKVFLDTRPTLSNTVVYSIKDEAYNYEYANKWESASLKLRDGDSLTVENLVYAALVGSANNATETLVRVSGLKRDEFILKMNQAAALWGASSTHFIEPTGLAPENVSSALDYAIITKEVYTHPIIQKASTMYQYKFSTSNTKKAHTIINTNKLLEVSSLKITGSKTGYLNEALYCLMVRAADKSNRQVIAVTMGADTSDKSFDETEELLKFGLKSIK